MGQQWQEKAGGESRWVAGTGLGKRKGGHGGQSSTQWVRTSSKGELKREIIRIVALAQMVKAGQDMKK